MILKMPDSAVIERNYTVCPRDINGEAYSLPRPFTSKLFGENLGKDGSLRDKKSGFQPKIWIAQCADLACWRCGVVGLSGDGVG